METEFIMDKNAYEAVVEDFLSLYVFSADGIKDAYRKEFKESFPIEEIKKILDSDSTSQADKIESKIHALGNRACRKFLVQDGEFELPYAEVANDSMIRLFVKPVYGEDCSRASHATLNSILYRL